MKTKTASGIVRTHHHHISHSANVQPRNDIREKLKSYETVDTNNFFFFFTRILCREMKRFMLVLILSQKKSGLMC